MAVLRSSLVRLVSMGAALCLSGDGFGQASPYRLGFGVPSPWLAPSFQQYYLPPEGSAPGLAFTGPGCRERLVQSGLGERTEVWCMLETPQVLPESRIHGWSISVRASGTGGKIASARSIFPGKAEFERTEVTSGEGNIGVVSTVVLSQGFPGETAASGGRFPIVAIEVHGAVPGGDCAEVNLRYEDGLRDSMGAVVRNEVLSAVETRLELEPCATQVCLRNEICDNGVDDDGDAKKDLNDADCVDYISDCGLFDCGGCRPFFDLFFTPGKGPRPRPETIQPMGGNQILIGAVSQVPLRGFELSGRATSWGNEFYIELTGDVPDEKGEPVRNVFLDTLGNRIPPLVSNMARGRVGWIDSVERGPDLEPFAATDFLSVDIGEGAAGPTFRVRYVTDQASPGAVIPPTMDGGDCIHRILTLKLGPSFHRGDANGDGKLNVTDAIAVILHLFGGLPLSCIEAGNADDDSTVNITDAVSLLVFLFQGGAAPPHPGPPGNPCGPDLTWSTPFIPCSTYEGC